MKRVLLLPAIHKMLAAFSWMLIHSLWQGLTMAVCTGIFLIVSKRSSAEFRYRVILSLFFLFLFTCVFTFERELSFSAIGTPVLNLKGSSFTSVQNTSVFKNILTNVLVWVGTNSTLIASLWLGIFLIRGSGLISGMLYFKKIRSKDIYRPEQVWIDTFQKLSAKLNIRQAIRLLESGSLKSPVVVGHFRPLVFIPLGLLSTLPADQIEAIFLHELAHIKRHDYLINIIQQVAESFFFFNPALLWVSRILKEEREFCCDELALRQTKDKAGLVKALINFKEFELNRSTPALSFASKKSHLLKRVGNILGQKKRMLEKTELTFFTVSVFALICLITLSSLVRVEKGIPKMRISIHNHSRQILKIHFRQLPSDTSGNRILKTDTLSGKKKNLSIRIQPGSGKKIWIDTVKMTPPDNEDQRSGMQIRRDTLKSGYGEIEDDPDLQNAAQDRRQSQEMARKNKEQSKRDRFEARQNRLEADHERRQNQEADKRDRKQAEQDRIQSQLDKVQADRDRIQNDVDRREQDNERIQRNKELNLDNEIRNKAEVDRIVLQNKKIALEQVGGNPDALKIDKEFAKNLEKQSREISERALEQASKVRALNTKEIKIQMEMLKKFISMHASSVNSQQKMALKMTQLQIEALNKRTELITRNALAEVTKLKEEQSRALKQQLEQLKQQSKAEDLKKDN